MTLTDRLPEGAEPDDVFSAFADWATEQGLAFYPHQEEALIEVVSGANVICPPRPVRARAWSRPVRTSPPWRGTTARSTPRPIKALVSEKFFALCDIFGAGRTSA